MKLSESKTSIYLAEQFAASSEFCWDRYKKAKPGARANALYWAFIATKDEAAKKVRFLRDCGVLLCLGHSDAIPEDSV